MMKMRSNSQVCVLLFGFVAVFAAVAFLSSLSWAAEAKGAQNVNMKIEDKAGIEKTGKDKEKDSPLRARIYPGESTVLQVAKNRPRPARVELANPVIADAMLLSTSEIYISGKSPGTTTLTLKGSDGAPYAVYVIEVAMHIPGLKQKLHEVLPGEADIMVSNAQDSLVLSGSVSSAINLSQALALAKSYAALDENGNPKIVNLLEVRGVHQVMLEVRVSEMGRTLSRRLGFNFSFISASGKQVGLSLLNNLTRLPIEGWPGHPITVTDNINMIFSFVKDGATWTTFIDALKEQGVLKVLAEPTLVALSGKTANFLAGGEFPVPVPQAAAGGTVITIDYKPFGVGLTFTPTVLSNGKIHMQVAPEVSELDFNSAVALQGFIIPSITTRRVSTSIELADGQSFAIAGLLKDEVREDVKKFPLLGEVPVLGALFRSTSFQKNETELVIIVTAHLVKPLDMKKQTLPTDQFVEPNDGEFYLLGNVEGRGERAPRISSTAPAKRSGMEGNFGHITP